MLHERFKTPQSSWSADEQDGFYVLLKTTEDHDQVNGAPKTEAIILDKEFKKF